MTKIAEFHIEDIFQITGRGFVFTGKIIDGFISIKNEIEFQVNNDFQRFLITGIEEVRHSTPDKVNIVLLIKKPDNLEIDQFKKFKDICSIVNIYNEKMTLSEMMKWLSTKPIEHKILFNELLLSDLTVMNRAIWSDDETDNSSKVNSLKWSNELAHRIWNITFELKRNEDDESENSLSAPLNLF